MAKRNRIPKEQIQLPLLNSLKSLGLFENKIPMDRMPLYITANLKHRLRGYQQAAIQNLDAVERMDHVDNPLNQLMFYMATGSGKTDIMAAVILYMYQELGYQCFLFTTSMTAVVNKTRDNMINGSSPKYLFNDPLTINGRRVTIREVEQYPVNLEPDTIYLKLIGVQKMSNDFYTPRENGITSDSLERHKLVILADEAHHFNVGTRSDKENVNSKNWENLLKDIRELNSENQQLEFTATIDLHNPDIYKKYKNKIIAQYDLGDFISDGYSKEVFRLQANNSDGEKMLNAVLLSQYRKRIARNMGIPDFKPVILFKSNTVKMSKAINQQFVTMINDLSAESLRSFVQSKNATTDSEALEMAYEYWLKQDFNTVVSELKREFGDPLTYINANDSGQKDILDNQSVAQKLGNLESPENPIRSVFAVAKLSEGWDVLNLYDIVRIGERNIKPNDTNAEAQLIGRGARYNPFVYKGKLSYQRRFDERKPAIQLLERLYYHTINNPKYIENLRKSLDAINLPVNEDTKYKTYTAKVKSGFKRSKAYRHGNIYYNHVAHVPESDYDRIQTYGFDPESTEPIDMVNSTTERNYNEGADHNDYNGTRIVNVARFSSVADKALIQTAISFNPFYRFETLRKQCPTLKSVQEFLTKDQWLGHATVQARIPEGAHLTPFQKLEVVGKYLVRVQIALVNNFKRAKGTNIFKPIAVREVIKDYDKRVGDRFSTGQSNGNLAKIGPYEMNGKPWYVYDYAIVDILEKEFIDKLGAQVPDFKNRYDNVYLLRIDERNTKFKLHDFDEETYHYQGYMPDFILYLEGADFIYQIYMEPKGGHLTGLDRWKENLLERINPENVELVGETDNVKLYGVKFYVKNDGHHMFAELRDKGILPLEN